MISAPPLAIAKSAYFGLAITIGQAAVVTMKRLIRSGSIARELPDDFIAEINEDGEKTQIEIFLDGRSIFKEYYSAEDLTPFHDVIQSPAGFEIIIVGDRGSYCRETVIAFGIDRSEKSVPPIPVTGRGPIALDNRIGLLNPNGSVTGLNELYNSLDDFLDAVEKE